MWEIACFGVDRCFLLIFQPHTHQDELPQALLFEIRKSDMAINTIYNAVLEFDKKFIQPQIRPGRTTKNKKLLDSILCNTKLKSVHFNEINLT